MNQYTQPNIEGISKLEIIETAKVDEITPQDALTGAPVAIVLKFGAAFEDIPLVAGSGEFSEDHLRDDSGDYHQQDIIFAIAKNRQDVDQWLNKYGHLDYVAKVTDRNGNIRVVGTLQSGASITAPMNNPAQGRNQYSITLTAISTERAPYLLSAESVSNSANVFNSDFSNEFVN